MQLWYSIFFTIIISLAQVLFGWERVGNSRMQNTRTAAAVVNDAYTLMHESSFCSGEPMKECSSEIGIPRLINTSCENLEVV